MTPLLAVLIGAAFVVPAWVFVHVAAIVEANG